MLFFSDHLFKYSYSFVIKFEYNIINQSILEYIMIKWAVFMDLLNIGKMLGI